MKALYNAKSSRKNAIVDASNSARWFAQSQCLECRDEQPMSETYIFDTCVFNRLADEEIRLSDISADGVFYATHVQHDELLATRNDVRRDELIAAFKEIGPQLLPTETFCLDVSRLDIDKLGDGQLFNSLKVRLDARKKKANNTQDALIAEVAIVQKLTLVTADTELADAAREHGAKVYWID
jgi:predicted nucleic acid-binding protein